MGFFSNPLKAHKKIAKAGVSATKSVVQAGIPKQSPARGILGGGGGGGGAPRTGGGLPAQQMGAPAGQPPRKAMKRTDRPYLAEGGKVGVPLQTKTPNKAMKRK